ncbi:hypothetical protein Tco_1267086, partial [Tanacetum coccineum]
RTVPLNPPVSAALRDSEDSIDKLFDKGNDDVPEETVAKDASEKLREDYHSVSSNTGGKSLATICDLVLDGSSVSSRVMEPPTVVSVPPTPDDGPTNSVSPATDVPVTTVLITTTVTADVSAVPPPKVRVVSKNLEIFGVSTSAGGANAVVAGTSKLNEPTDSSDSFYASLDLNSETLHRIYVPKWNVTNDSILDNPYVCRDLTDHLSPPALFSQLHAMDYDQLYFEFNVEATRQVCLGAEVRMRAEHTLEQKARLKDKCSEQAALLSKRDTEIVHLKSLLSLKEDEATEAIRLRREKDALFEKVKTLESIDALKETEKSSLESAFELFSERMKATQDEQILTHGLKLVILKCLQSPEYCHALGLAIGCAVNKGIQDGLRAGVDHGKAGRDLSVIEAYDPFAEAKYVKAVNALGTVNFSLLSELKSKKDASIVDLIDSLRLEGPLVEIPRAEDLQPSPEQLRLPIYRPKDNIVLGETSLSFSLQVVHSRVQRVKGEIMEKRLSLTDVMVPLAEPLSSRSLIGEASTSAVPSTVELVTTLSTTFASSSFVPPLSVSDY